MCELDSGLVLEFCQLLQHRKRFYKKIRAIYISCFKAVKLEMGIALSMHSREREPAIIKAGLKKAVKLKMEIALRYAVQRGGREKKFCEQRTNAYIV
jgi:hypothetical protein